MHLTHISSKHDPQITQNVQSQAARISDALAFGKGRRSDKEAISDLLSRTRESDIKHVSPW